MSVQRLGRVIVAGVFDSPRYPRLAQEVKDGYAVADPFPHVVVDDFLPSDVAREVAQSFPRPHSTEINSWKYHENENTTRWFLEDSRQFPAPMRTLAAALGERPFMQFLTTVTGIPSLLLDPYFIGGGAMSSPSGGFLRVHADFNWHALLQAWRRVNVLLYLTPDWQPDWGGQLELWARDGSVCVKTVDFCFNRAVIFTTASDSFHGQPNPLKTPKGTSRNIFSAFYYSPLRGEATEEDPHFTKYALDQSPYSKQILDEYAGGSAATEAQGLGAEDSASG